MPALPITRVVLYKHGVGYFERQGQVEQDAALSLTFKQSEVSDVLKSLTVLDLNGGHVSSVSYDSTKPLEQLLAEISLSIPDENSVLGLLPQLKGAHLAVTPVGAERTEGVLLGVDTVQRQSADGVVQTAMLSLLTEPGEVRSFALYELRRLEILDAALRRDLDFYLRTQLSSKKKDARTFTFFTQGEGERTIVLSYTLEAPVWKATYRIILPGEPGALTTGAPPATGAKPMIQGWAVVDNTQDEDWENVQLSLISGLPVSFVHDLYTPRYIRRPVVEVQETTGVLPPEVEAGMEAMALADSVVMAAAASAPEARRMTKMRAEPMGGGVGGRGGLAFRPSSMPAQVRERKIGDLFEYEIEHPVTIRRNQSALVPIVLRPFEGRPVLLYNKQTRAENPMRCVEFKNTTGLTLEGGPVTVLEAGSYVGEAMLETTKPDEQRLVPYAVELGVRVLDNIDSHSDGVHRVTIRRGVLKTHYALVEQITYHFDNKGDSEQTVYLDHPRQGKEWKLVDTAEPHEITEHYWRFKFALPARKLATLVVKQRLVLHQSYTVVEAAAANLAFWIEQRYLDEPTVQLLKRIIDVQQQAARLGEQIDQLTREKDTIHAEQKRIRENLQALGDRSSEKELRERFVRILNEQEDRLDQIGKETKQRAAERDRCREQVNELLAGLEFEKTL
jgi:hypothetical protein